ncbi:hypothetical protein DERF_005056 [Dermatophagoides farinae]|uniref:Uncharacterized protein n=1 Tax=Dermatophagoides farinae TaxID=6954 RepID=A0A922L669_DERFA|nr:hypothetical protein DERF_005056 [Dermatophagoides farinae]
MIPKPGRPTYDKSNQSVFSRFLAKALEAVRANRIIKATWKRTVRISLPIRFHAMSLNRTCVAEIENQN